MNVGLGGENAAGQKTVFIIAAVAVKVFRQLLLTADQRIAGVTAVAVQMGRHAGKLAFQVAVRAHAEFVVVMEDLVGQAALEGSVGIVASTVVTMCV